jgi:hypothetical protein
MESGQRKQHNKLAMSMGLELNLRKTYTRRIAHDKNRQHCLTSTKMTKTSVATFKPPIFTQINGSKSSTSLAR